MQKKNIYKLPFYTEVSTLHIKQNSYKEIYKNFTPKYYVTINKENYIIKIQRQSDSKKKQKLENRKSELRFEEKPIKNRKKQIED